MYVTVTENLDKDQNIDISHIFIDHDLTDSLIYSDILMNQSHQVDIYAMLNESIGKYKTTDIIYWDINHTDNDTGDNYTVTYNRTVYYDGDSIEMSCDYVLGDKSCLIVVHGIIGTETQHDYLSLPTLKEKIVIDGVKIEQKESGIPLPKLSVIQLRYTVKHPVPYGSDYDIIDTNYNKYNITVCSTSDLDECTTLDPIWYNTSIDYYRPVTVNISKDAIDYPILINITNVTGAQADCSDMHFTDKYNITEWDHYTLECNPTYALVWIEGNFTTANLTQIGCWYGNTTAVTDQSNGTAVFEFFDDFNDASIDTDKWTEIAGTWTEANGYLRANPTGGVPDIKTTSYRPENDVIVEWSFYAEQDTRLAYLKAYNDADNAWRFFAGFYISGDTIYTRTPNGAIDQSALTISSGTWYNIQNNITGKTITTKELSSGVSSTSTDTTYNYSDGTFPIGFYVDSSTTSEYYRFDNMIVRKLISPEPTYSIGAQISQPLAEFIVYLESPANNSDTIDKTPDFNFTVNGTESTYSCELFMNSTGYGTNATVSNDTETTIIVNASLDLGSYDWYINCSANGVENSSDTWTLEIEPYFDVTLNAPVDYYNTSDSTPEFNFTVDGSEDNYTCELFINDTGYGIYDDWCYQESVNVSTSCGGLDTGTYSSNGLSYPYTAVDEDWNTGTWGANGIHANAYLNYTKPSSATNDSLWRVKTALVSLNNYTIDATCWNYNPNLIELRIYSYSTAATTSYNKIYCNNGSWVQLQSGSATGFSAAIYEDAIWWYVELQNDTATIITANDTLTDGTYDWYINCTVDNTVNQSGTRSITIDTTLPQITFVSPTDTDNTNVTHNYTYLNWTVTEIHQDTMILSWNGSNSTVTDTYINKTGLSDGTYTYYVWVNDTSGNGNQSETRTFTIDTIAPAVSVYYQWNTANDTVDFGIWTDGFVSVNWNLTDTVGINVSTCDIKVRNRDTATNYTNLSYINDSLHPDYDAVTGYKDLTCYTEDMGDGVIRVTANMTRSYDWRPLITAFDQDNAAHDNIFNNFGGRSTRMIFHNITNLINTTFIFLADVDNQTATVADLLFYSCNSSYTSGDFTVSPYCTLVGAAKPGNDRDVNFNYLIGALTTDENGSFGGVVHTETMYGISYCPSCTNVNNAWQTFSTNGYEGHSETSTNQGSHWSTLSGSEFNVILHVIDNTELDFNLTIDDYLENTLSDLQPDAYGPLGNLAPFGDITTDNITGSLVSYYDVHGITESGTICVNVTVSDPNADTMNVSIYLLNNDSSYNQTLLLNQSVDAYGIICHQWDTTNVSDGDYRLNVTAHDGFLIGYDESAGYIRIDNGIIIIDLLTPADDATTTDNTPSFSFTVTGNNDSYDCNITINGTSYNFSDTYQEDPDAYSYTSYYYYANYTVLDYYSGIDSIWTVSHGAVIKNYTLKDCNPTNTLQFRIFSNESGYFHLYNYSAECWDGTGWHILDQDNGTTCGPSCGGDTFDAPAYLYDGDWTTHAQFSSGMWAWTQTSSEDRAVSSINEEAMYWTINIYNDTSSTIWIDDTLDDGLHDWNITCGYDTFTNTSDTWQLTVDSISESVHTDFGSYGGPEYAWGFPEGIDDLDTTDIMLIVSVNFSQQSPAASATSYSVNITDTYVTNASNYDLIQVLNSTYDNITYTFIDGVLNFSTPAIDASESYDLYINITKGPTMYTTYIYSADIGLMLIMDCVTLDDSITTNVSGSFWVHRALEDDTQFDGNRRSIQMGYSFGDVDFAFDMFLFVGYLGNIVPVTKDIELDNSISSDENVDGHPLIVYPNLRAWDSASDSWMDKLTYNASFPNQNITVAKQEFSLALFTYSSDIDGPYIPSSSSTYEPPDTPRSGEGLDAPEDIIEEIKKKFLEERLLVCPTGYFFNHTSNRCEPYISPLAILEQDIINSTKELFGLLTRPVVIDVPVYIQKHTTLGPQLVIPSIFFILLLVAAIYMYYSKTATKDIVSGLREFLKTSRTLRPSPTVTARIVGRQKILRPAA